MPGSEKRRRTIEEWSECPGDAAPSDKAAQPPKPKEIDMDVYWFYGAYA